MVLTVPSNSSGNCPKFSTYFIRSVLAHDCQSLWLLWAAALGVPRHPGHLVMLLLWAVVGPLEGCWKENHINSLSEGAEHSRFSQEWVVLYGLLSSWALEGSVCAVMHSWALENQVTYILQTAEIWRMSEGSFIWSWLLCASWSSRAPNAMANTSVWRTAA